MSEIQWNDELSVNIDEIDDQHKNLIRIINRLDDAVSQGHRSKKTVPPTDVLSEMIDYLEYHFSTEEKYMIEFDYPEYDAHRAEHELFVGKVTTFTEEFRKGKKDLSNDILLFLADWYLNHIKNTDAKFGPFLIAKGLA